MSNGDSNVVHGLGIDRIDLQNKLSFIPVHEKWNARVLNNDAFLHYKEVHDPEKSLLKKAWKRVLIVVAEEAN